MAEPENSRKVEVDQAKLTMLKHAVSGIASDLIRDNMQTDVVVSSTGRIGISVNVSFNVSIEI